MLIIVPTVKHTGSHFIRDDLLRDYEKVPLKGPHSYIMENIEGVKTKRKISEAALMDHLIYSKVQQFQKLITKDGNICITPLRHPKLVAKSWLDKGLELKPDFYQMWTSLIDLEQFLVKKDSKIYFLPLDVDDREDYLEALNEGTGLGLHTNWEATGENAKLRYNDVTYKELIGHRMKTIENEKGDFLKKVPRTPEGSEVEEFVNSDKIVKFLKRFYKPKKKG